MAKAARITMTRRTTMVTAGVLATIALAFGAAGCSAVSPITTDKAYSASDGVRVELGSDIRGENLMLVSAAKGDSARVLGAITNDGTSDAVVTLTIGTQDITVATPAGGTVLLSAPGLNTETPRPDGDTNLDATIDASPAAPGALATVTVSTPSDGSISVQVPVLDGTLPAYAAMLP